MNRSDITIGSFFDGIGGALLCATICGAMPVWASEIEKFPIAVTTHHFPGVVHLGDITKINGAEIPPVDIAVGGSPCQDVSVAGKRKGMKHSELGDKEGTRSGLFMEQIRIIKEQRREYGKPRFMVWENVPGALSSNNGEDFRVVLEETARVADSTVSIPRSFSGWANAGSILANGFSISWRIIDAQYWGVPQRRRRVYLVADFGGQSAPQILFEREGLPRDIAQSRESWKGTSGVAKTGIGSAGFKGNQGSKAGGIGYARETAPTVLAGQGGHVICYSNGGFANYKQDDISATQRACVAKQTDVDLIVCFEPRSQDGIPRISKDGLSPTINTAQGGQRQPCVFSFQRSDEYSESDKASTEASRQYKSATDLVVARCLKAKANLSFRDDPDTIVRNNNTVRRLTPLECERLQGYPDNYTNIPKSSDTARYKALGNSFEIDCALFVISGCVEVLANI